MTTPTRDEAVRSLLNSIKGKQRHEIVPIVAGRIADALTAPAPASGGVDAVLTVPARDGIEARSALNDVFPGDPYPVQTVLADIRQRHVQAIGAGLSRRDWHATETSYNGLRDAMDDLLRRLQPASLAPAATPVSEAGGELPVIPDDDADFTPDLARKIIAGYQRLLLAKPASSPASVREALEGFRSLTKQVMTALMATRGRDDLLLADQVHRADTAARIALSQSTDKPTEKETP